MRMQLPSQVSRSSFDSAPGQGLIAGTHALKGYAARA